MLIATQRVWLKPLGQSIVDIDPVLTLHVRRMEQNGKVLGGKLSELSFHMFSYKLVKRSN
jgi:hypothetical protein